MCYVHCLPFLPPPCLYPRQSAELTQVDLDAWTIAPLSKFCITTSLVKWSYVKEINQAGNIGNLLATGCWVINELFMTKHIWELIQSMKEPAVVDQLPCEWECVLSTLLYLTSTAPGPLPVPQPYLYSTLTCTPAVPVLHTYLYPSRTCTPPSPVLQPYLCLTRT